MKIQVGDLVETKFRDGYGLGLVVEWYDSVNGMVYVRWGDIDNPYPYVANPISISKLTLLARPDEQSAGKS
jgi:hypothetical protein